MSENRPGSAQLIGEEADARRRTAARFAELRKAVGSESGDGNNGSGGGNREIAEALLLAALGATVGRGGLSNAGSLSRAALHGSLHKRSSQSRGEGFFPEEHVAFSPNVSMAGLTLARQGDPRMVAQALGLDVDRVREVQRNLRIQDMDTVLRGDYDRGVIEQAARVNVWRQGPDPNTPPEQLWRRALGEDADLSGMNARELALTWLSAANSTEPGAREAQERVFDELAEKHPQVAEAIERHTRKDVNFVGDPHSARIDANSVMSAASPQANGRPMETMEQLWTRTIPTFKDPRENLDKLRDTAESLTAAVVDGRAPVTSLGELRQNASANKALPGFAKDYQEGRRLAQARADKGQLNAFPQGDGILYALDKGRGLPVDEQPRGRAEFIAAGNAVKADLRAHDASRSANPRLVMDSRLPETLGQLGQAQQLAGASAVARPQESRTADARASATTGNSDVRYPRGEAAREAHRDGGGVRLGRLDGKQVAAGNRHTRDSGTRYRHGETLKAVKGESPVGLPKKQRQARAALARLKVQETNSRRTARTTRTRRAAAR
ncbi:hypothetical protein ACIBFB_07170 [Nocardiopsis sp. NPDC050513]|uniref:hypothetical protein n=1 Tax=Nocardiopsis sp. NPDC050513 TaxID=3364338 RepID=UPI0037AED640